MYMLQLLRQWSRKSGNWKEDLPQYHCCVLTKKVAKLNQTSWGPEQDHDLIEKSNVTTLILRIFWLDNKYLYKALE